MSEGREDKNLGRDSTNVEKESPVREVFSKVRDILSEGESIVSKYFDTVYGRKEGEDFKRTDTETKLGDLSEMILSIENNPEAFSCVEIPKEPWTDNFGNIHMSKIINILGRGSYSLGIYIEDYQNHEVVKDNLMHTIKFDMDRAGEIRHQAGYGNRREDEIEIMLKQAESLMEKARQLAVKWVRKIDFALIDGQTPIIGVTIADTPSGLAISPRDPLDINTIRKNKMGFLFSRPILLEKSVSYDELIQGINKYPEIAKNLIKRYSEGNFS